MAGSQVETEADISKRIKYSDWAIEVGGGVRDFLPPPEQLALAATSLSTAVVLSQRSMEFFKEAAQRNNTSHQLLIQRILEAYVDHELSAGSRR